MKDDFDWNETAIARLRQLWAEGYSTQEIANAMGVSKNAVIGKVHRIDLPARPSPIGLRAPGGPKRERKPVLPPLPTLPVSAKPPSPAAAPSPAKSPKKRIIAAKKAPALRLSPTLTGPAATKSPAKPPADPITFATPRAVSVPPVFLYAAGGMGCQFPLWPNGQRHLDGEPPRFCGQPRCRHESSYCQHHHAIVWHPAGSRSVSPRSAAA